MNIMAEIVATRTERIAREGAALGQPVPERRVQPLVPFGREPFIICEIKRRSPSRGEISTSLDAPEQAARYGAGGARTVSVLTEEDHFRGSLADLMAVKERNPDLCVLRKDFLLTVEDVELSYRAGADAVLLIAAILEVPVLKEMYERASALGLACLFEVHTPDDVAKAAQVRPRFTGINARDLTSFAVDLSLPLDLSSRIDWETVLVFESGIHSREHAAFAAASGFQGILVGEAVVRNRNLVSELIAGLADGRTPGGRAVPSGEDATAGRRDHTGHTVTSAEEEPFSERSLPGGGPGPGRRDFWRRLYARRAEGRPLVKVCGLTNREDALRADELGADLLGFVLAPSRRRADPHAVQRVGPTRALKVGVVVLSGPAPRLDPETAALLEEGILDAVQFHGDETPDQCFGLAFPYYKALQLQSAEQCARIDEYRCPRVLIDAHVDGLRGGTGATLSDSIVREARNHRPLWLAGGIGPDNVEEILSRFSPELIDSSSALEASPGHKDSRALRAFFAAIDRRTPSPVDA